MSIKQYIKSTTKRLGNITLEQVKEEVGHVEEVLNATREKINKRRLDLNTYIMEQASLETLLETLQQKVVELTPPPPPIPIQNQNYVSIEELRNHINNDYQKDILFRITNDREYARIYLRNFVRSQDNKKPNLLGTINLLGTYNKSKDKREVYEIKVYNQHQQGGTFWCSCADHKFNSAKKNTVCKHICFVVCKIMRILQTYFFETKTLSSEHLNLLLEKFQENAELWKDTNVVRLTNTLKYDTFKTFTKVIDDTCSICFDQMTEVDKPLLVSCPSCKNCFHEECMYIWLENYDRCTICFNNVWKNFYHCKKGGQVELK